MLQVVRIVSSEFALRIAVALDQAPQGRRISELSKSLGEPFTSVGRALDVLVADGVVARHGHRFVLRAGPQAAALVRLAVAFLEPTDVLVAATRSDRAVELCGQDEQGTVVVTRRFADPSDEAALARLLELLRETRGIEVEVLDKGTSRDRLTVDDAPRRRALGMRVLSGSVDRSFPHRSRHGDPQARLLGTLHPSPTMPSQRRLRDLARRYRLRRVEAFGSATRTDFRPDSDVDLLTGPLAPEMRARLDRDAVVLYDAGR